MTKAHFELSTHVELPQQWATLLYTYALQYKMTASEIVQKGIALIAIALKAEQEGFKLAVITHDGKIVNEIAGLRDPIPAAAKEIAQAAPVPRQGESTHTHRQGASEKTSESINQNQPQ